MSLLICDRFKINPFDLRRENAEEVITLIKRFSSYGAKKENVQNFTSEKTNREKSNGRKLVYADTSTGGWY